MSTARARAHPNIALVKYWGKRDRTLNLPAVGSISMTLDRMRSETQVTFDESLNRDVLVLNGVEQEAETRRVSRFLDRVREHAGVETRARVESDNNFPTAAGLASSASGFAALALAATRAAQVALGERELSILARLGSGSAPRSLWGGFVEMAAGSAEDGSDAVAHQLHDEMHWPLCVAVVVTTSSKKAVNSTEAMQLSQRTSPFYPAWVRDNPSNLQEARAAVAARDFERLAIVAEANCLRMHAVAMAGDPGVLFWNDTTIRVIHAVRAARAAGTAAFFTIDAGPQVKVFSEAGSGMDLAGIEGVENVIEVGVGPGAHIL